MKKKYKNFISKNKRYVKYCIKEIKKIDDIFMPEDKEIQRARSLMVKIINLHGEFKRITNKNITYKQFIQLFNRAY